MVAEEFLARARSIAGLIESEADSVERGATITKPVIDAIATNRLFWLLGRGRPTHPARLPQVGTLTRPVPAGST